MKREIEIYVESLFEKVPSNKRIRELKEEILSNSLDRYNDLIDKGIEKEEAYDTVVGNIGNIEDLIEDYNIHNYKEADERKKTAKITAIAIVLYILSPVGVILCDAFGYMEEIGIISLFAMVAIATGMLVYHNMSKIKKYDREDESIVELLKEKKSVDYNKTKLKKTVSSAVWSIVTAIYFIVSFLTGSWHITWVIFIIGSAVDKLIITFVELKEEKDYV